MGGITFQVLQFIRKKDINRSLHKYNLLSNLLPPFEVQAQKGTLFSKFYFVTFLYIVTMQDLRF